MAILSKENGLQREAFEIYYAMGDFRSLRAVAEKVDRTERTVASWSRAFNWVDRVKQREIEDERNASSDLMNMQTTDIKTRYRILIAHLTRRATGNINDGTIAVRNVEDLERVITLDQLLTGEATKRVGTTQEAVLPEDIRTLLDERIAELKK